MSSNKTNTRSGFRSLFPNQSAAIAFEHGVLSIGGDYLPECARAVRDGEVDEPGPEYWAFLASQVEIAEFGGGQ